MSAATSFPLMAAYISALLPSTRYFKQANKPFTCSSQSRVPFKIRMTSPTQTKTKVVFLPNNQVEEATNGETLLDVAIRAGVAVEKGDAFCRDGGCYTCEMEVGGELMRTCQCKVGDSALKIDRDGCLNVVQ